MAKIWQGPRTADAGQYHGGIPWEADLLTHLILHRLRFPCDIRELEGSPPSILKAMSTPRPWLSRSLTMVSLPLRRHTAREPSAGPRLVVMHA